MKSTLTLLTAVAIALSAGAANPESIADAYASEGYTLVWHDEFDNPDISYPSEAAYEVPRRQAPTWKRFISTRKDLMVISDGVLKMYCRPNPPEERTEADPGIMVSGAIQTKNHFSLQYGRIEARMKVDGFTGSFPAFWMMPVNQPDGWPTAGEIDIFESINNEDVAYATLHTGRYADNDINTPVYRVPTDIDDWHVYAVEWTPESLSFFIDGRKYGTVTPATIREGLWPFNEGEFYIILNQSVGKEGGWAAAPDPTHTYLTEVDWLRVYQLPGSPVTGASTSPTPIQ